MTTTSSSGYGSTSPVYYSLFALTILFVSVSSWWLLSRHERSYEVRGRYPLMVVFGMIGSTLVMGVFAVLYVFPGNSMVEEGVCLAGELLQSAGFYLFSVSYLIRAIRIRNIFLNRKGTPHDFHRTNSSRALRVLHPPRISGSERHSGAFLATGERGSEERPRSILSNGSPAADSPSRLSDIAPLEFSTPPAQNDFSNSLKGAFQRMQARNSSQSRYNDRRLFLTYFSFLIVDLLLVGMVQVIRGVVLGEDCEVGLTQKIEQTGLGLSTIISIVQIVFIFIIITAAGIRVHGIPDKFNIALEIRIASIVFALVAIASVIIIIKVGQPGAATIPLLVYFPCCFLGAVISPYLLYHREKKVMSSSSLTEFRELLNNKAFVEDFQAFAAEELSAENVMAWSEIKLFRDLSLENNPRVAELGERICNEYVRSSAPFQANLEQNVVEAILEKADRGEYPIDLFDRMRTALEKMMFDDTYQRFFSEQQRTGTVVIRGGAGTRISITDVTF
jgi:hypothetical protein